MDNKRRRQRRLIRKLFELGIFDVDDIDQGLALLGIERVERRMPSLDGVDIGFHVAPRLPVARLIAPRRRGNGEGCVYVLKAADGLHKIGSSTRLHKRIESLNTAHAKPLQLILVIPTIQHTHHILESTLHNRLADRHVRGEWFALTPSDITALRSLVPAAA